MKKLRTAAATFAVMALAAAPVGVASASNFQAGQHSNNSQAGQHGNHCGLGHQRHVTGSDARNQGGLRIGQTCNKAHHGGGDENNGGDDDAGGDGGS